MAPALTQAAESQSLSICGPSQDILSSPRASTEYLKLHQTWPGDIKVCDIQKRGYISNGLAPPACGRAEGRPLPPKPSLSNMDESSSLNSHTPQSSSSSLVNMGCHTSVSGLALYTSNKSHASNQADTNALGSQQSDLMALMGRDFDNVNEIIDTLQKLASNPELLDAAAQDIETGASQERVMKNPKEEDTSALVSLLQRHRKLERRKLHLLRRLRKVTARGLGINVSSQLSQLYVTGKHMVQEELAKQPPRTASQTDSKEPEAEIEGLHREAMKNMSTTALINLVKHVEASHIMKQASSPPVVPPLSLHTRAEVATITAEVAAALQVHLSHDSDATESSSGGESCDEMEGYDVHNTDVQSIRRRALYKYCRRRSGLASKWLWLQAQIADLDYRIMEQQKIRTHIRTAKGPVTLAEDVAARLIKSARDPAHVTIHDPALTCIGSASRTAINGFHTNSLNKLEAQDSACAHENYGCARTLGIYRIRRRRCIRLESLLKQNSMQENRGNSSKLLCSMCRCVPPLTCILCKVPGPRSSVYYNFPSNKKLGYNHSSSSVKNSVYNFYQSNQCVCGLDLVLHSTSERLSNVDPAFHPVLSSPAEMLQSECFNSILQVPEYQHRVIAARKHCMGPRHAEEESPQLPVPKKKKEKDTFTRLELRKHRRERDCKRYSNSKTEKPPVIVSVPKPSQLESTERESEECREVESKKKRLHSGDEGVVARRSRNFKDDDDISVDIEVSTASKLAETSSCNSSSPCPSPALSCDRVPLKKHSLGIKNKSLNTNSYDINNIVIPYSMAASTRVEKLEYKEIPTPKWREVDVITPLKRRPSVDEVEDVSDEVFSVRHGQCEEEEKKRFFSYRALNATRSSRSRRTDSSGTNTPDHPLSPRISDQPLESVSPMVTPPDTPLAPSEDSNQSTLGRNDASDCGNHITTDVANSTVLTFSLSTITNSFSSRSSPAQASVSALSNPSPLSSEDAASVGCSGVEQHMSSDTKVHASGIRTRRMNSEVRARTSCSLEDGRTLDKEEAVHPYPVRKFPLSEDEFQCIMEEETSLRRIRENTEKCFVPKFDCAQEEMEGTCVLPSLPLNSQFKQRKESRTSRQNSGRSDSEMLMNEFILVESSRDAVEMTDPESGRSSPMSEVTDSASEDASAQLDASEDTTAPKWTISAFRDGPGQFVLQVQRN